MATKLEQHAIRKRSGINRAIRQAERQLADADPVMKRLIARHGRCPLAERNFEPFHMLANSIISQQLSTRAAATIKQRVGALVGVPFQTDKVLAVPQELLRGAGLSAAKARYIRELAARVCEGRLNFIELMAFDDEQLIITTEPDIAAFISHQSRVAAVQNSSNRVKNRSLVGK